jgi:hypothetical protein
MATEPRRINVRADSEVGRLLEEAATGPLILEKDGELYRLIRVEQEDIWAGYDPERARGRHRYRHAH